MTTHVLLLCIGVLSLQSPPMIMFHYPRWSPDGEWLLFSSNFDGNDEEIWIARRDGSQRQKLTDNEMSDTAADWLADGRIVFHRQGAAGPELHVMNRDGSNVRRWSETATPERHGLSVDEHVTPGGQTVLLKQQGRPDRIISTARWSEQPVISPDGRFIAFEQRENPNDVLGSEIGLWDVKKQTASVLARGTDPSWSPDGRLVMFKAPSPDGNVLTITLVDIESRRSRPVAPGVHPHFSPDGLWIAFMGDQHARADIYIIRTDGTTRRCLTCSWR